MTMEFRVHKFVPFLGVLILPLATFIFAVGFFPYKPFISGANVFSPSEQENAPSPRFDKIILMVVDALRSDFVYSNESGFAFVQGLINRGHALPFTAHASSPTITMPKVKAITTGSVPSFLDVILNFAESDTTSTLGNVDTWVGQLRQKPNGKLVMNGDDTWLKLFPNFFARSDGTSSFFVSDFTEVDNNVTRHIDSELQQSDWNGWFMHYLGLDHIGHKSGPQSPHMLPKQQEMDRIVQRLYEGITNVSYLSSTLIVLCGDHGMNEAGNHGGAAPGETSPALVFISPKLEALKRESSHAPSHPHRDFEFYKVVEQSDIAPTVSALLGLPPPLNNLGVIITDMLELWPHDSDKVHLLRQNVRQVHAILEETLGSQSFSDEALGQLDCSRVEGDLQQLQCGWRAYKADAGDDSMRISLLKGYLKTAQSLLSTTASNYDTTKMFTGLLLSLFLLVAHSMALWDHAKTATSKASSVFVVLVTLLHGSMMFASSFVEEEHQYWYWMGNLLAVYLFYLRPTKTIRSAQNAGLFILFTAALRVCRRWNQTGQKFAGSPDIGRKFLCGRPLLLWAFVILTYVYFGTLLALSKPSRMSRKADFILVASVSIVALAFKISFTGADAPELLLGLDRYLGAFTNARALILQARLAFSLLAISALYIIVGSSATAQRSDVPNAIRYLISIFLSLQLRANNIPLLLVFEVMAFAIQRLTWNGATLSLTETAVTSIIMQHISYFAMGGTNAISSIDLSNAYNGVSGYNVLAVGILTFVSNWVGPVWWATAIATSLLRADSNASFWNRFANTLSFFVSGSVAATMAACTLLRAHLFIWTVFSPKYLYTLAWTLAQHVVINLGMVWGISTLLSKIK